MGGGRPPRRICRGGYVPPSQRGTTLTSPFHMVDFFATLCGLAGVDPTDTAAASAHPPQPPIDSMDVWPLLSGANTTSPRTEIHVSGDTLLQFDPPSDSGPIYKLMVGVQNRAGWAGPVYPNSTSTPSNDVSSVSMDCGEGCLWEVRSDPSETHNLASAQPARLAAMLARLAVLNTTIHSNSDVGVSVCPAGTGDCACWAAVHLHKNTLGPWQY